MGEVEEFVAHWGLDPSASQLIAGLSPDVQARVLAGFHPAEDTQNINGRLWSFVRSVSATDGAARQMGLPTDALAAFAEKWGLQQDSVELLTGLQPEVLSRVLREFRPNGETMNVGGRLRAFVRSVSASVLQGDAILQFAQKWGLDEDSIQFLGTLPPEALQRVLVGFTPNAATTNMGGRLRAFARSVMTGARGPAGAHAPVALAHLGARTPEAAGPEGPEALAGFAAAWGLGEESLDLLRRLPEPVARQVTAEFVPLQGLEAVDEQFQAFAVSTLAAAGAAAGPVGPPPAASRRRAGPVGPVGPPEGVEEFLQRWGLGADAAAFLEGLPAEHLQVVLRDFRPAGDTKNVLGRLMGFARNLGRPSPGHPARQAPAAPALAPAAAPAAAHASEELTALALTWGLDEETIRFLQGLPPEVLSRVAREFTPNQETRNVGARLRAFARSVMQSAASAAQPDPVQQFVERWGLDAGAAAFLNALPEEARHKVLLGFHPNGDTVNLQGRLQAFARGVLARAAGGCGQQAGAIAAFAAHWGLSASSVALLGELPMETLQTVLSDFRPPGDTFNVDGRLQGFVRSVASAATGKRMAEPAPLLLQPKRQRC